MPDHKNHHSDSHGYKREPVDDTCGPRGRGRSGGINPVYELLVLGELMVQPSAPRRR